MSNSPLENTIDRRTQILDAAMACFAKQGFHQTTMHDISAEAGISVGLIYRYFENKDAVISAMAEEHKTEVHQWLERARQAPTLLEAVEILFTSHCCDNAPQIVSAFVVDLFAEASRNPRLADLVRDVCNAALNGLTDLIARAPELRQAEHDMSPRELAELLFALNDGMLMRHILILNPEPAEIRERQLYIARRLWRVLFRPAHEPVVA